MAGLIVNPGTQRTTGKDALSMNIAAAKAVASIVKTTLGPKGMDKMMVNVMGDITLTNDGATILQEMEIENPTAKMVVEVAKTQETEAGDGTTTAVVISGALLEKTENLIDMGVHPSIIIKGYNMAAEKSLQVLKDYSIKVGKDDREGLEKAAMTCITGKASEIARDLLVKMCVDAVYAIDTDGDVNVDENITVLKEVGGSIDDTELIEGIVLNKESLHPEMPRSVKDAKIALIDTDLTFSKTSTKSRLIINSAEQLLDFQEQEKADLRADVQKIIDSGANVVFCAKNIDDYAVHYLKEANVFATRRLNDDDMRMLSRSTNGRLIRNVSEITADDLGYAEVVEQVNVNEEKIYVKGFKDVKNMTILIRGGTEHVTNSVERVFDDALHVVQTVYKDGTIVAGGGATEVEVAQALRTYAASTQGREQLAINAFADAIEEIPRTIADNCGFDAIDTILKLRAAHGSVKYAGLDIETGEAADMLERNIVDPLRVKTQAIKSAVEVCTMVLRVDDMLKAREQAMMDVAPEHNIHNYDSTGMM